MSELIGLLGEGLREFEEAARSIFAQPSPSWQSLIVSDGSASEVFEWIESFRALRVSVVVESDGRRFAARVHELSNDANTDTDYPVRVDADDVMHPDKVAIQSTFPSADPDADVLGSRSPLVSESLENGGHYRGPQLHHDSTGYMRSVVFSHSMIVYKRSWALEIPYDLAGSEPRRTNSGYARPPRVSLPNLRSNYFSAKRLSSCRFQLKQPTSSIGGSRRRSGRVSRRESLSPSYPTGHRVKRAMFRALVTNGKSRLVRASKKLPLSAEGLSSGRGTLRTALSAELPEWVTDTTPSEGAQ